MSREILSLKDCILNTNFLPIPEEILDTPFGSVVKISKGKRIEAYDGGGIASWNASLINTRILPTEIGLKVVHRGKLDSLEFKDSNGINRIGSSDIITATILTWYKRPDEKYWNWWVFLEK